MLHKRSQKILFFLVCCVCEFATLQLFLDTNPFAVKPVCILKNLCLLLVGNGVLVCLLQRMRQTFFVSGGLVLLIGLANYCMYQIRGYGMIGMDFHALSTAASMAGNYSIRLAPCLFAGLAVGVLTPVLAACLLPKGKETIFQKKPLPVSIAGLCVCAGFIGWLHLSDIFWAGVSDVYWDNQIGFREQGYLLYFAANAKRLPEREPEGYSAWRAQQILDDYMAGEDTSEEPPHLIVIMNEAFSDLRVWGEFTCDREVMPFWDSLQDNTVKGYADVSIFGGYTANSEFEFLTGCSKAFLSGSPYLENIFDKTPALPATLKSSGVYKQATAFHPYYSSGYRREQIYPLLGFDKFLSLEDINGVETIGEYVSDRADYEEIIRMFEARNGQSPFCLFNVTIQNHSPYHQKPETDNPVRVTSFSADKEVNHYLSLLRESDDALEGLVRYFQSIEEPTVIVLFGDHQPRLPDAFYYQMTGKVPVQYTAEEAMTKYRVPFMIWANYDIPEKRVEHLSLNYLSTELAGEVGLPRCAYQRFLADMQEQIPSLCAGGYFDREEHFHEWDDIQEPEKQWIEKYKMVQYYTLFEKKRQNKYYKILSSKRHGDGD